MSFSSRNFKSGNKKQNEFFIVSNLLNDIKKSEKIRMKIFCFDDIFSEDFFSIITKIISFYFHLSRSIKNLQNYDNLLKQNKIEISSEIKKFFDKIIAFRKSKNNYLDFYIEKQINFSFTKEEKKNKKKSHRNLKKMEIITTYKNTEKYNSIFSYENQKKGKTTKYKSLSQTKSSYVTNTDNLNNIMKKTKKNQSLKKNLSKKDLTNSRNSKTLNNGENSTNKSSISHSNIILSSKNLNKSIKIKSKSIEKKKIGKKEDNKNENENYTYVQIPNLTYLRLLLNNKSKGKNNLKYKSKSLNKFIPNIKLVDTGPKPSLYTNYLLNKFKGYIDTYNIEEQKNYSPYSNKYQSHSTCNIKKYINDSSRKSIFND